MKRSIFSVNLKNIPDCSTRFQGLYYTSNIREVRGRGGEDYTSNPDKICQIQLNERMMNVSKWEQRNKKINENEIRSAGWWLVGGIEEN